MVVVVCVIFTGLFATTLYSLFQLRKPNQTQYQQFVFMGSIICGFVMVFTLHQQSAALLIPLGCAYGAFSQNIIPIVLDQVVDICPAEFLPTINTLQAIAAQAVSSLTTLYFGVILNEKTRFASRLCFFIFIGYYGIGLVLAMILRCCLKSIKEKNMPTLRLTDQVLADK